FAASEWAAQSLVDDCKVDASRVSILYPATGLTIPSGIQEPKADAEILFVGLDWERKGGPLLYDAFRLVQKELPHCTLRIVGCRPRLRGRGVIVEGPLRKDDPVQAERLARCYL